MIPALSLQAQLDRMTAAGALFEVVDAEERKIRCLACGHRCLIKDGRRGICQVRYNDGGTLRVPHGYVGALQIDPVEKKPFFHVLPGASVLSFGMLGCDFRCSYCQNWEISQTLRDDAAGRDYMPISADELIALGTRRHAQAVASTYNEPLITTEWAVDVFRRAKGAGMLTLYVSNGNGTREVIDYLKPWIDGYKIDLKTMQDRHYRKVMGGVLQHVLDTIKWVHEAGIWLEVLTLVIPGFNDSNDELWDAARFIREVSPDVPLACHRFPSRLQDDRPGPDTRRDARSRRRDRLRGRAALRILRQPAGRTAEWEDTRCPGCGKTLARRRGFLVTENRLSASGGVCPGLGRRSPASGAEGPMSGNWVRF